jgi:hypothetical protein
MVPKRWRDCRSSSPIPPRRDAYFFVGAAVYGAVALNGSIHPCRSSLSTEREGDDSIRRASLTRLEASVSGIGLDASSIWGRHDAWPDYGAALSNWIEEDGAAIAQAALETASMIDFEAAIVDGIFPLSARALGACGWRSDRAGHGRPHRPDRSAGRIGRPLRPLTWGRGSPLAGRVQQRRARRRS